MDFVRYQHICRLGDSETTGILNGICHVFYKIDGTNAQVYLNNNGELECASRNRVITPEDDNAGFAKYIHSRTNEQLLLDQYPNFKLCGEWLVPHTLKTYRNDAWRRFYIFDIIEVNGEDTRYVPYEEYQPILEDFEIDYIPPICIMKNPTNDSLIKCLEHTGNFLIEDESGLGEGIVIKNYDYRNQYGRQTWAKIVRAEFKEKHGKAMGVPHLEIEPETERKIVDEYITESLVHKEMAKIATEMGGWESKYIPRLLETVFYCLMTEESYNFTRKYKFPVIDTKKLKYEANTIIKKFMLTF